MLAARQQKSEEKEVWFSAKEIVAEAAMSVKFLEQILVDLKAGGIIKSRRGPSGGHAAKPARQRK